jgi:hypothetical protein
MMKRIGIPLNIAILAILVFTMLPACKKYEEGPAISFRSKKERVVNTWKLDSYLYDGVDKTGELTVTNYTEIYNEDGSCKRTFNDSSNDFVDQPGTWSFSDDKAKLSINGIGSVELNQNIGTVSASSITIIKLKEKEMWYRFENGGHTHEFHLIEK